MLNNHDFTPCNADHVCFMSYICQRKLYSEPAMSRMSRFAISNFRFQRSALSFLPIAQLAIYIIYVSVFVFATVLPASAQEPGGNHADSVGRKPLLARDILEASRTDTCSMEGTADGFDAAAAGMPWMPGTYSWPLHEGFNAEVGLSVSASFGKHRRKGAGFGEHFAAAYAMPFGKDRRWMGAIGLYVDRMDWGNWHDTEAGIAGMLGYRVNEWCSLYLYGAYNFMPSPYSYGYPVCPMYYGGMPGVWDVPAYDAYGRLKGRIGAAAQFKLGKAAAITVAVEHDFIEGQHGLFDTTHGVPGYDPTRPSGHGVGTRRTQQVDYGTRPGMPVSRNE